MNSSLLEILPIRAWHVIGYIGSGVKATSEGPSAGGCRNGNSPHHEVFFEERFLTSWVQLPTHPLCFQYLL